MKACCLVLVPEGGLGNRMRAIASAYNLCRLAGYGLKVVWFKDWALNARFCDVFHVNEEAFLVKEATFCDLLLNSRPRRHNLWISAIPQHIIYAGIIQSSKVQTLNRANFDFKNWLESGRLCYMSSYESFGIYPQSLYKDLFKPNDGIMAHIDNYTRLFSDYTIGMHIRRTDNEVSIKRSPTSLFIEAGQKELEEHPDMKIFLATDSEVVKRELKNAFGDRVITADRPASRDSLEGIQDGVVDMWTLSRTVRIYGSSYSTFSVMASYIGGNELIVVER